MERKTALLVVIGTVTFLIALSITLFVTARTDASPTPPALQKCNVLQYNDPQAFTVLFIASKEQATRYREYFLSNPPYDRHKNEFNIMYLDHLDPKTFCTRYKGIASLCYSETLLKAAAACPHNAIIVLVDEPVQIRSSAYKNVLSLNENHPPQEVLRHEFGHFYGLAEEYTEASLPAGQRNCQSTCTPFEAFTSACFAGCSKDTLYRSIEAGVMRTLQSSDYGVYNEFLIEQKMKVLHSRTSKTITGDVAEVMSSCEDQSFYLLEIDASQEPWAVRTQEKVTGCPSGITGTEYHAELKDGAGNIRATTSLSGNTLFTDAPGEETIEGEAYEESSFWIEMPSDPAGDFFQVYDQTGKERGSTSLPRGGTALCRRS